MKRRAAVVTPAIACATIAAAQPAQFAQGVRQFIKIDAPVVALTHARVIDGTGAVTLNGAMYPGRDARVGSLAVGKQADLAVVNGDPSTTIADVRNVETAFRQGVGCDPAKLIASVSGKVGLW